MVRRYSLQVPAAWGRGDLISFKSSGEKDFRWLIIDPSRGCGKGWLFVVIGLVMGAADVWYLLPETRSLFGTYIVTFKSLHVEGHKRPVKEGDQRRKSLGGIMLCLGSSGLQEWCICITGYDAGIEVQKKDF
jgi:hypothetical protein